MRSAFYRWAVALIAALVSVTACGPKTQSHSCYRAVTLSFPPLIAPMAESHLPPMPATPTPAPCTVRPNPSAHRSQRK
jgi:hypothetical protein